MFTIKKITAVLVLSVGMMNYSMAQDDAMWTIGECIDYAVDNNISLKRQALATEIQNKDLAQSKLNALPNLNGQVSHDLGAGRVLDRGTYEWLNTEVSQGDLGLVSNVTLFKGLQGYNSIKMAKASYLASKAGLELSEDNLILNVMTAYLELMRMEELYTIAREKLKVAELQVKRMQKLVEVGNASEGELLEVKATASAEKYNLTIAKTNQDNARLSLIQLMNLTPEDEFGIIKPEIEDPSEFQVPSLEAVYGKAIEVLPHVDQAQHQITYEKKRLSVARGALSPELFVRALYYSNYSDKLINPRELDPMNPVLDYTIPQQVLDNQYKQISVGLNIPIFNKWQTRTDISKAKISLQDAEYNLIDTRQQLFKDIQKYHSELLGALENYNSARESQNNSEEAYRYAEEKFRVGMATALELEEARNRLFAARSEMITAKYVFVFYKQILDFFSGSNVSFS